MKKILGIFVFCLFLLGLTNLFVTIALADTALPRLKKTPQNTLIFLRHQPIQYRVKPSFEKYLMHNYLQHYYFPWNNPLAACMPPLDLLYTEYTVVDEFENNPGWNENKKRHTKTWIEQIVKNMDLKQFPNHKTKAITINLTNLRLLPTNIPSFSNPKEAGQGYPFDNLQISLLKTNLPIYIVQTTHDGAWNFVITPSDAIGWVKTKDIARVNAQFIKQWQAKKYDYITPVLGKQPIKGKNEEYYFSTRIGELYPLVKHNDKYDTILVAAKDLNDNAIIREAKISQKIAHQWPILTTSKNIARFANRFLGVPYGWGDLYGYRDCSSTTRDLFAPFAIWLPRHSTQQATTGVMHDISTKSSDEKKQILLQKGIPFFTLLWLHGHVLIYIGRWHDNAIVFHSPWGVHTKSLFFHKAGRIVIGHTVITPLNLGQGHLNVPKTWLDEIQSFTYLVPHQQLIKIKPRINNKPN